MGPVLLHRRGFVLDADTNVACHILARLYADGMALYMPYREVKALLAERTRTAMESARLELRGLATRSPSTKSEGPSIHRV